MVVKGENEKRGSRGGARPGMRIGVVVLVLCVAAIVFLRDRSQRREDTLGQAKSLAFLGRYPDNRVLFAELMAYAPETGAPTVRARCQALIDGRGEYGETAAELDRTLHAFFGDTHVRWIFHISIEPIVKPGDVFLAGNQGSVRLGIGVSETMVSSKQIPHRVFFNCAPWLGYPAKAETVR